jgi:hypothetical protein
MALAPSLPLANDYPSGSSPHAIFDALSLPLRTESLSSVERNDGLARVNTFCDSLLFCDDILNSLDGLLQREAVLPFTLSDISLQFGPRAAENCKTSFDHEVWPAPGSEDTKLGVFMGPEVSHGATKIYAGV